MCEEGATRGGKGKEKEYRELDIDKMKNNKRYPSVGTRENPART